MVKVHLDDREYAGLKEAESAVVWQQIVRSCFVTMAHADLVAHGALDAVAAADGLELVDELEGALGRAQLREGALDKVLHLRATAEEGGEWAAKAKTVWERAGD